MRFSIFFLSLLPFLFSCNETPKTGTWEENGVTYSTEVQTLPSGLRYIHHKKHKGKSPAIKDYILRNFLILNPKGDTVINTYRYDRPMGRELLKPPYPGALEEGLALLKANDSMTIFLTAEQAFAETLPKGVQKGDTISYVIRVYDIFSPKEYKTYLDIETRTQLEKDRQMILDKAKKESIPLKPFDKMFVDVSAQTKDANQAPFQPGDSIVFNYVSSFLGGMTFDGSFDPRNAADTKPVGVLIGSKQFHYLMPGWKLMFQSVLREGMQASAYMPSAYAFGMQGRDAIPPNAIIITKFKILEVHRAKNKEVKAIYEKAAKLGQTVQPI